MKHKCHVHCQFQVSKSLTYQTQLSKEKKKLFFPCLPYLSSSESAFRDGLCAAGGPDWVRGACLMPFFETTCWQLFVRDRRGLRWGGKSTL